jgi:hypothetical protein
VLVMTANPTSTALSVKISSDSFDQCRSLVGRLDYQSGNAIPGSSRRVHLSTSCESPDQQPTCRTTSRTSHSVPCGSSIDERPLTQPLSTDCTFTGPASCV